MARKSKPGPAYGIASVVAGILSLAFMAGVKVNPAFVIPSLIAGMVAVAFGAQVRSNVGGRPARLGIALAILSFILFAVYMMLVSNGLIGQ